MEIFDVYFQLVKVGELTQERSGELIFRYLPTWLKDKNAIPISLSLPLTSHIHGSEKAMPFFYNLLPEQEIKIEYPGAVTVFPSQYFHSGKSQYRLLSSQCINEFITTAKSHKNLLPIFKKENALFIPMQNSVSSHFLKVTTDSENELFCMLLARSLGLNVANITIFKGFLLLERYDRMVVASGTLSKIHQETFCQALSFIPADKDKMTAVSSLMQCFSLLKSHSIQPAIDQKQLLQWVIFNYLIGNEDADVRNLSLLLTMDGVRLAPFYSLFSSDHSSPLGMKIGGEVRPEFLLASHWELLAAEIGIKSRFVFDLLEAMKEKILSCAEEVMGSMANNTELNIDCVYKIYNVIKNRCLRAHSWTLKSYY